MAHILLADDEEMFRDLLQTILMAEGHVCEVAANGEDALNILRKMSFDVFLCDLIMGPMSGIEAMAVARDINPDIKVVAVSGATGYPRQAGTNIPIGADAIVMKPFKIKELTGVIEQVLAEV